MQKKLADICKNKNIMIMAGGTGGHIFPALAVARKLKLLGAKVSWLGTKNGLEATQVDHDIPLDFISVKGIRRKSLIKKLIFPFGVLFAILQSIKIIRKRKVDLVLGFGGYASGPGGIATYLLRIPLIIHEQNARAGITNKYLAKIAKHILYAFPCIDFQNVKTTVVGNPLRENILKLYNEEKSFNRTSLNLLIIGGSSGAKFLNEVTPAAIAILPNGTRPNIWHQTGIKLYEQTLENYADIEADIKVEPFIEKMSEAYRWADIIICRAGASTVSEVATAGVPAIFIPYPYAVDNHQYHNAQVLVRAKAARCITQENLTPEKLAAFIRAWDMDRQTLIEMSQHAKGVAMVGAVDDVIKVMSRYLIN